MLKPMQMQDNLANRERRAASLSLMVGVLLSIIKFGAYIMTGSAVVFSDALESIVNVLASGFALYAIILAHTPADRDHPYGHGKIEFLAAGFEGGMIVFAALIILWEAVQKLMQRHGVNKLGLGLLLIAATGMVNGITGFYLIRMGRRSGSITLEADGKHLLTDFVTTMVVLASLGLIWLSGLNWIDPVAAILIAVYLFWTAKGLLRHSAAGLMDEQDRDDDSRIRRILDSHLAPAGKSPQICSYHKLRHRHSGRYHWIDFHIMVPAHWNIQQSHNVASAIEYEIELALGEGNATAHVEPCQDSDCPAFDAPELKIATHGSG
ncbi:MAG TPA: cation diffusion facilitator family transporter [Tepidisphaeraceae bacterium]|nr:cation diffusion facilitator family transporter [Tepidisphaeraceae bacterium]